MGVNTKLAIWIPHQTVQVALQVLSHFKHTAELSQQCLLCRLLVPAGLLDIDLKTFHAKNVFRLARISRGPLEWLFLVFLLN